MRKANAARASRSCRPKSALLGLVATAILGTPVAPAEAAPTASPNPLAFNPQRAGTFSASRAVLLTNNDMVAFNVSQIEITGADSGSFTVASGGTCQPSTTVLQPGDSCSVNVAFVPASAGPKAATLEVREVDMDPVTVPVALQGTGTGPASVSPATMVFPSTQTGTTSPPATVTVEQNGNTISNMRIESGGDAARFAVSGGTCGGPSGGPTCTIDVTFAPLQARGHSSALLFDDGPGSTQRVPLSGEGIEPVAAVSPASLEFVAQVGRSSATQSATIRNDGRALLTVSAIRIFGPDDARFALSGGTCTNATLPPGQSCTVGVTFMPADPRAYSATLRFTTNSRSVSGATEDIALAGTGLTTPPPDRDGDGMPDIHDGCPQAPGVAPDGCPDADRDGVSNRVDRCPRSPGDRRNGCPTRLNADIRGVWRVNRLLTQLVSLSVTAPVGSRIEVRCSAKRRRVCPFGRRTIGRTRRRTTSLTRYFHGHRILPAATMVTVRVTKSRRIGSYERIVTRAGLRLPQATARCISTGGRVVRCG